MVGGPICFPLNATLHDIDAKFVEYLRAAPPALLSNPARLVGHDDEGGVALSNDPAAG
jgi:hypothetical protein